jgi:hypothetical protein
MVVEFGHLKPRSEPALQNSADSEKSLGNESVAFSKIQNNSAKTEKIGRNEVERTRNRENFETQNSVDLTELSSGLTELSASFSKKNRFLSIKKI